MGYDWYDREDYDRSNRSGMSPNEILSQEKAGSDVVVYGDRIPASGTQGEQEQRFLDAGFKLGEKTDQVMREAVLPPNWTKVPNREDPRGVCLVDDKGMIRGSIFIKSTSYDYYGSTSLYPEGSDYIRPFDEGE
ncbi:MAG: hypothetical protein ACXABY_00860 [Candidatus Thorarchaeota archaeon]|jgi:hypothetical protein